MATGYLLYREINRGLSQAPTRACFFNEALSALFARHRAGRPARLTHIMHARAPSEQNGRVKEEDHAFNSLERNYTHSYLPVSFSLANNCGRCFFDIAMLFSALLSLVNPTDLTENSFEPYCGYH